MTALYFNGSKRGIEMKQFSSYEYTRMGRTTRDNIKMWVAIVLAALFFPVTLALLAHRHEAIQSRTYAISFSEVEEIECKSEAGNYPLSSLNHFLPLAYDGIMKVLECSNVAVKRSFFTTDYDNFLASELDMRLEPSLRVYKYDLSNLLGEKGYLRRWSDPQKNTDLKQLQTVLACAQRVSLSLSPVWDVNHEDIYRTEYYTTVETDANGSTHMVTQSHEVYDYTIHTYTYHPENSLKALSATEELMRVPFPDDLLIFHIARSTHAENEYAQDTSIRRRDMDHRLREGQMLMHTQTWLHATSIPADLRASKSLLCKAVPASFLGWKEICGQAKSVKYQNTNREKEEPGPEDYQAFFRLQSAVTSLCQHTGKVFYIVDFLLSRLEQIGSDACALIKIEKEGGSGSAAKFRDQILKNAEAAYKVGFENSSSPSYYRVWLVAVWAVVGVMLAVLVLFLLDHFNIIAFPRN